MPFFHHQSAAPASSSSDSDSDSSSVAASLPTQQRTVRTFKERPHHHNKKQHNRRHAEGRRKLADAYSDSASSASDSETPSSRPVASYSAPVSAFSARPNAEAPSSSDANLGDNRPRTVNVFRQPSSTTDPLLSLTSSLAPTGNSSNASRITSYPNLDSSSSDDTTRPTLNGARPSANLSDAEDDARSAAAEQRKERLA